MAPVFPLPSGADGVRGRETAGQEPAVGTGQRSVTTIEPLGD